MKHETYEETGVFVPYDDENLKHIEAGPHYGQPGYFDWESEEIFYQFDQLWERADASEYNKGTVHYVLSA